MSAGAIGDEGFPLVEEKRHVHYCKDYADKTGAACLARGYCECDCGARAMRGIGVGYEWIVQFEAKEPTT